MGSVAGVPRPQRLDVAVDALGVQGGERGVVHARRRLGEFEERHGECEVCGVLDDRCGDEREMPASMHAWAQLGHESLGSHCGHGGIGMVIKGLPGFEPGVAPRSGSARSDVATLDARCRFARPQALWVPLHGSATLRMTWEWLPSPVTGARHS